MINTVQMLSVRLVEVIRLTSHDRNLGTLYDLEKM